MTAALAVSPSLLLTYAALAIVALIVLITKVRLNPFLTLVVVSLGMGLAAGMPAAAVVKSMQDGIGGVLGFLSVVLALGTMLGKMLAESGGAERIARTLIDLMGEKRVHWALMLVGFCVGLPMFFQVGFVLLIPLVFTVARATRTSLIKVGIPLVAGLSIVHGLVPPHPAAMLLVGMFKADVGLTIVYALIVGLPAAAIAGPLFASAIHRHIHLPAENPMAEQLGETGHASLPGFGISLFTILLPMLLMVGSSIADLTLAAGQPLRNAMDFIGNPVMALLTATLVSFYTFGKQRGFDRVAILKFTNECLAPTAILMLVIGAGGGFNRVLLDSGVGKAIADMATSLSLSPLVMGWLVAAVIRIATGSATVAMTTAGGIMAPILLAAGAPHVSPELMVLAAGSGSLVASHVNDAGFWQMKEYFNMTVPQTLAVWTVCETILSVAALVFTLILAAFVG
jgi:GntP family gluconate:H+ symporter